MRTFALLLAALALGACVGNRAVPDGERFQLERNTDFDGERLDFYLDLEEFRGDVNSDDDAIATGPRPTPIPGHTARDWTFLKEKEDGTTVSYALVSWHPETPSEDYVVLGWWAEFPGQTVADLSFADSIRVSIIDGPALDHGTIPEPPRDGTATYAGPAGGLYEYQFGSAWGAPPGAFVLEEYEGTIELTADFADGSVRGCVGCSGDIVTRRAHFGVFLGEDLPPLPGIEGLMKDYEIHLGERAHVI